MDGYYDHTYGDAFADVYDDWYSGVSDVDATVADLLDLSAGGDILELGIGTGRLAIPLAMAGIAQNVTVTGVDSSAVMLQELARKDQANLVNAIHGDMASDLPGGPFSLVFCAYNTLFNLTSDDEQGRCFSSVASILEPGGRFVVEAFVPDDPPRRGDDVSIRTLSADRVVLSVSRHDGERQAAEGQFIEFSETGGIRLRPWSIRYSTPEALDAMAERAGFKREFRWESFGRAPFGDGSQRHVTVYRTNDLHNQRQANNALTTERHRRVSTDVEQPSAKRPILGSR
jgi:SAM-dependent methyltransferase